MVEKLSINSEDFNKNYNNKEPQLIVLKFKSESIDLLNSFMKISEDHENSFLFESLKDGDLSGRYSVIGIKPDKILKIRKKVSKIYNGKKIAETVNCRNCVDPQLVSLSPLQPPPPQLPLQSS